MRSVLLVLAVYVLAVKADFPAINYYIQSIWGCPGEHGANTAFKDKCNQYLQVQSDEYVKLSRTNPTRFYLIPTGRKNEYRIKAGSKYISYHTKMSNWIVTDKKDNYMSWEIRPRGGGFGIRSKYNCPKWPCDQEMTTGNSNEKFLWLEKGYYHAYRLIPAE